MLCQSPHLVIPMAALVHSRHHVDNVCSLSLVNSCRRLPPEPPLPPRTPPLFGLPPREPPAPPLGLKQGLVPRKRKPSAAPPAARAPAPPGDAGRQPGSFLAAAGLVPLPALRRPPAWDPRSVQQTPQRLQHCVQQQQSAVQQLQQQQQQQGPLLSQLGAAATSMGPLGLFLQQAAAAAAAAPASRGARQHTPAEGAWQQQGQPKSHCPQQQGKEPRPSSASSAATVTASEPDAAGDSDWSGAESAQLAAAVPEPHKKRRKLVTGGRRPPPLQRPAPRGAAAAVMAKAEAGAYLPLDM